MWPDRQTWTEVIRQEAKNAVLERPTHNLMMCWPALDDQWAEEAITASRGEYVIYIGEGPGGCTGTDKMHFLIEEQFELRHTLRIPRFDGMRDRLEVWRRKK